MRRLLTLTLGVLVLLLGWPALGAAAHPIDSTNIDQYSRLEVGRTSIRLRYIVEMGDLPAFLERRAIDTNVDAQLSSDEQERYLSKRIPELIGGLSLAADGARLELRLVSKEISFPEVVIEDVQGALIMLRIVLDLEAQLPEVTQPTSFEYHNDNFADATGWREIVVRPRAGILLSDSTAPDHDQSDELRGYPKNIARLDIRAASFTAAPGTATQPPAPEMAAVPRQVPQSVDRFAQLIAAPVLTPQVLLFSLLLAFALGAVHALAPGHGKTIVAAYLVGNRGNARHALFLGIVTTITHTVGVFVLGFVTLLVSNYVLPERLYPWLEFLSGAIVAGIGLVLFRHRLADLLGYRRSHHDHDHNHDHDHGHDHEHPDHSHLPPGADDRPVTWRSLLALGVSGGLLPCPSALVVLLGAIALHRVAFGMLLIVVFSFGLAGILIGIGLLLVYARRLFERFPSDGQLLRAISVASAVVVTLAGLAIAAGALAQVGWLPI